MNFLIRQIVRTTFLIVHQIVRMTFLTVRQLVRTNFAIRQLARTIFLIRQLVRIVPVICPVSFVFSIAFTVSALTKYTPPLLINGSCPSPKLKKDFFAKCVSNPCSHKQRTLKISFVTFTTWKSYRFV